MRHFLTLPVQLIFIGCLLGMSMLGLAAGHVLVPILLFAFSAAFGRRLWLTYGWQIWHFEKTLMSIEMLPIPIAIYDSADRLIACNALYAQHHPRANGKLNLLDRRFRPSYADILDAGLDPSLTAAERVTIINESIMQQPMADGKLVERQFPNVGWLRIGKRRFPDGGTVRVAIEINELKARETDLIEAIEHGRRADDMKSKFFSKMTHELRTPLNGIIGMSNVILLDDLDPKTTRNMEILRSSGVHLLDVVNRVLDFSRLNEHVGADKSIDFDLLELVREVLSESQFSPHAEGLNLKVEHAPDFPRHWTGNRTGLRQVLTNLVGNGLKFTKRGCVIVRLAERGNVLAVDVVDTGIGIPKDQLDQIFEAFRQVDGDWAQHYGGTGLGLTICAEIIEAMGGTIEVESTPRKGSCFRLQVPMTPHRDQSEISIAS